MAKSTHDLFMNDVLMLAMEWIDIGQIPGLDSRVAIIDEALLAEGNGLSGILPSCLCNHGGLDVNL